MRYASIIAIALIAVLFVLAAGCVQKQSTSTTTKNITQNTINNTNNAKPLSNETNVSVASVGNGTELNDSSEVGYISNNVSVF